MTLRPGSSLCNLCIGALFACCVCASGCGGVLEVTKHSNTPGNLGNTEQLPGVPFYAVGYRCVHTTVWLQPIYRATVVVMQTDGTAVASATKYFGRKEFNAEGTQNVLGQIRALSQLASVSAYDGIMNSFQKLNGINPVEFDTRKIPIETSREHGEALLAGNFTAPDRYVDTSSTFYYNVKKPVVGSANAEIDLTNEGIISKTSAQVTDQTAQTVLSALPISTLIQAAATPLLAFNPNEAPTGAGKYKVGLEVQTTIYKHTHTNVMASSMPPCATATGVVGADGNGDFSFTVEDVTAPTNPQTPAAPKPPTTDKPKPSSQDH